MNTKKKNHGPPYDRPRLTAAKPSLHLLYISALIALGLIATPLPLLASPKEVTAPEDPFASIQKTWITPDALTTEIYKEQRHTSIGAIQDALKTDEQSSQTAKDFSTELHALPSAESAGWIPLPSASSKLLKTSASEILDAGSTVEKKWVDPRNLNHNITTTNKAAMPLPFTLPTITVIDKQIVTPSDMPEIVLDTVKKEEAPVPAAPTRQVNLAPLPVLTLPVMEKSETSDPTTVEAIPYSNASLQNGFADKDWKELSQLHLSKTSLVADKEASKNIRLAGMPSGKALTEVQAKNAATTAKSAQTTSVPQVKPKTKAKADAKNKEETAANAESCNTANTYIKKQIAAIESDNKTIQALQAAIEELGLSQKLDYTPGAARITPAAIEAKKAIDKTQAQ